MHGWWLLAFAVALEVAGTTCMKLSEGLTRLWPSLGIVVFYLASFACVTIALKHIDVSVAYAVWAGLGVVLITIVGVFFFGESMTLWRAASIVLVLLGVIGLKIAH